jgi:di/tricarboxylate transporter
MYFVIILLVIVAILFATDKIRPDFIALAALCVLILSGILPVNEALLAFGNSTVILVAALFVVGKALSNSGVTQLIGNFISSKVKKGQDNKLIGLLMASVAFLSSFMSSTGVVSLFVPVTRKIATNNQVNIKKLLLPVAYAGLISGMTTLIATPPNMIVAQELESSGLEPFGMLAFTQLHPGLFIVQPLCGFS